MRWSSRSAVLYLSVYQIQFLYSNGFRLQLLEQLLDEVNVSHYHATAAVAVQAELVHGITMARSVCAAQIRLILSRTLPPFALPQASQSAPRGLQLPASNK